MENNGEARVVGMSMTYNQQLKNKLEQKARECEELKAQLAECQNLATYHADLSRSYCDDWSLVCEKNRKLKKRLRKREEQLKKVGSILNTMETMFNIRGE